MPTTITVKRSPNRKPYETFPLMKLKRIRNVLILTVVVAALACMFFCFDVGFSVISIQYFIDNTGTPILAFFGAVLILEVIYALMIRISGRYIQSRRSSDSFLFAKELNGYKVTKLGAFTGYLALLALVSTTIIVCIFILVVMQAFTT